MTDLKYPKEWTPALREVLSTMCFMCIPIAEALRKSGEQINRRAEDEQAAVLHYLIPFALEHGDGWRRAAVADLECRRDRPASPAPDKEGRE